MIINPDEMKVIQLILDNDIVHYRDIERTIGKSRKTVNKYLNHIAVIVSDYDVELVRKRSVGIFFEGEVDQLKRQIWQVRKLHMCRVMLVMPQRHYPINTGYLMLS